MQCVGDWAVAERFNVESTVSGDEAGHCATGKILYGLMHA